MVRVERLQLERVVTRRARAHVARDDGRPLFSAANPAEAHNLAGSEAVRALRVELESARRTRVDAREGAFRSLGYIR